MSNEREMVLLRTSDLIEEDSYGVYGSEFYRCKLCGRESGAGVLNKGITHDDTCPLVAPPDPAIVGGDLPDWLLVLIGEYGFAASAMTDVDRLHRWQELIAGIKRYAKAAAPAPVHADDDAVDKFAAAMKEKMAAARAKGRGGWEDKAQCTAETLSRMLVDHVAKGDPRDVANFCMMLWNRGESICASNQQPTSDAAPAPGVGGAVTPHREWRSALTLAVEVMESEAAMQVEGGHDAYAARMKRAMAVMRSMITAPPAPQGDARDAARWRALVGSARVRYIGSAGLTSEPGGTDAPDGYAHIDMGFWTKYRDAPTADNTQGVEMLTKYADAAIAAQAGEKS